MLTGINLEMTSIVAGVVNVSIVVALVTFARALQRAYISGRLGGLEPLFSCSAFLGST